MKRITSLLLALVLALTLAGCGSASQNTSADAAPQDYGSYWDMNGSDAYETSESPRDDMLVEESDSAAGGTQNTKPVKMIYTGYMEMQTLDFDKASSDIDALVKELGGYFQQSSVSNGSDGYRRANYTIRVPAAQFEPFFRQAGQLCHVTYKNASADDVSESYYDTEARLETARIKLERLQTLLAKATSMEDIITIESAISETEWDIENLSGTLRHYDALVDCCHVYTYGVDVLKQFSDGKGDLANVRFLLHNDTDGYFVTAKLVGGVYYVTGHEVKESKATAFAPNGEWHIRVMGLEDDTYTLTETDTDKGYVLLKDGIEIIITAAEGESACETCGVKLLTASGSVNGDAVDMENGNAIVPLTVINNPGFDLPKTGGYGTWMFTVGGCMLLGVAAFIVVRGRKHNRNDQ